MKKKAALEKKKQLSAMYWRKRMEKSMKSMKFVSKKIILRPDGVEVISFVYGYFEKKV